MKHKVGDKVKITANKYGHNIAIGRVLVIDDVDFVDRDYLCDGRYVQESECELYIEHKFTHPDIAPEGHKWQTLDGEPVEQVTVFEAKSGERITYVRDGMLCSGSLMDAPPEVKVFYINIDEDECDTIFYSRTEADSEAFGDRVACVRVEYYEGQYDE